MILLSMKNEVTIREFEIDDVEPCSKLIFRAIEKGMPRHYSTTQIAEAKEYFTEQELLSDMKNRYVAEIDGLPVGTIGLVKYVGCETTGLIVMFFVDPIHQRKGIGTKLEEYVEDMARAEGWRSIRVNASFNALGFYQVLGFEGLGDDEKIHDLGTAMVKSISHTEIGMRNACERRRPIDGKS
jgi:GNAT superfamily N-acetyltransferase